MDPISCTRDLRLSRLLSCYSLAVRPCPRYIYHHLPPLNSGHLRQTHKCLTWVKPVYCMHNGPVSLLSQRGAPSEQAVPACAHWEDALLEFIPKQFFLCTCQNQAEDRACQASPLLVLGGPPGPLPKLQSCVFSEMGCEVLCKSTTAGGRWVRPTSGP